MASYDQTERLSGVPTARDILAVPACRAGKCLSLHRGADGEVCSHAQHQVVTVLNEVSTFSTRRIWNSAHLLFCMIQVAAVSWSLLTPDPFALVRDTSLDWIENAGDLLMHAVVFTVLSATVFSLCLAIVGEIPAGAVFAMLGYCLTGEGLQEFVPGRTCDPRDAIANVAGFALGFAFVRVFILLRPAPAKA